MEDEGEHIKEVFAHFGLALYLAQCHSGYYPYSYGYSSYPYTYNRSYSATYPYAYYGGYNYCDY